MATTTKPAVFKLPKTLAECGDLLYTTQQERFALNKQVEALQARETALREHLINTLPKSEATGISGKIANIRITSATVPSISAENWPKLYAYILANAKKEPGVWGLLQRRLGDGLVKEMWEAGKKVPGVEPTEVKKVSCTKVA